MNNNFKIDTSYNSTVYTYAYSHNHPQSVKQQFELLKNTQSRIEAIRDGKTPRLREMRDIAKIHNVNYKDLLPEGFLQSKLFIKSASEIYVYASKFIIDEYKDALNDYLEFIDNCHDVTYLQTFNLFHVSLFNMSDTNISSGRINDMSTRAISYKFHKRMVKLISLAEGEQVASVKQEIVRERLCYANLNRLPGDVKILESILARQEDAVKNYSNENSTLEKTPLVA
jgi:hypothetical protein